MRIDPSKVVDLSNPMIPGEEYFNVAVRNYDVSEGLANHEHDPDDWYILSDISFCSHAGTHIEVPFHHYKDGVDCMDFPLENLMGEACVLDFTDKRPGDFDNNTPGDGITLEDMKKYEHLIKPRDIVFLRTNCDKLFRSDRWHDEVYMERDAMDWLVKNFQPKIVGSDGTGFEAPGGDYPYHLNLLGAGIPMIESACNLHLLGERGYVFCVPLAIKGADACPIRIIGIKEGGFLPD